MSFLRRHWLNVLALAVSSFVFLVPFAFIALTVLKDKQEAALLDFSWPTSIHLWENVVEVVTTRNWMLVTAFINSTILTVASVTLLVIFAAMVGFVLQRRKTRWNGLINFLVLAGLMMPPAVVPTVWLLQSIGLFAKLHGLVLIEVAYGLSFSIILYRAFIATIPRELDEAAIIDGARPLDVFFRVILPLLWPVTVPEGGATSAAPDEPLTVTVPTFRYRDMTVGGGRRWAETGTVVLVDVPPGDVPPEIVDPPEDEEAW